MDEGNRPSRAPTGHGKSLNSLPKGSEDAISGTTDHGKRVVPEGAAADFDASYGPGSNVVGPKSKKFV